MKTILLLPVIAGVALLSFACSKEPTKAIAYDADVHEYAPDAIATMHSDLAVVEVSLDRADVDAARYLLAKKRVKAARATLERIVAGTQRTQPSASDSETLRDI
jgi:hypothetical protein